MFKNVITILGCTCLAAFTVHAGEDNRYGMFGVEVGVTYTVKPIIEAGASNTPFWEFRAPVPQDSPLTQFHDFAISVNPQNNHVAGLRAERAYGVADDCLKERNAILRYLVSRFGEPFDASKGRFLSGDEKTVEVHCMLSEASPYYTLTLEVHSRKEWDQIKLRLSNANNR